MASEKRALEALMLSLEALKFDAYATDVENDEQFVRVMQQCKEVLKLSDGEIADIFLVSTPTVGRWLTGASAPHPAMRRSIYNWITQETTKRLMAMI